jgi:glycosyltransferase involved in cell wall biosynthesis
MQENGFEVILASAQGKEIQQIEKETGLQVHILPLTRKISPLTDLKALWKTYQLIKKHKPEIVHTHTPKAGIVGMLAAKLAGVPIRMHTVAGMPLMETNGIKKIILKWVEKLTYWSATRIYPNSFGLKKIIINLQLAPENKLKVLANGSSNGIDTTHFNPTLFPDEQKEKLKTQLGIVSDDFVFVFVGRLVGDKGINELVMAFKHLSAQNKKVKLLLVGDEEPELDPLLPETQKTIQNHPSIITTGWVNDVRPYFAISDVLVFPSYREGFPNVVLQAGAMGLASIVSNINGCNEIIEHNFNGLIVPAKDKQKLQSAMKLLLDDQPLKTKLANNARPNIVAKYKQEVVWQALLQEYNRLLSI